MEDVLWTGQTWIEFIASRRLKISWFPSWISYFDKEDNLEIESSQSPFGWLQNSFEAFLATQFLTVYESFFTG
jgi:hypothetical protein